MNVQEIIEHTVALSTDKLVAGLQAKLMPECIGCQHAGIRHARVAAERSIERWETTVRFKLTVGCGQHACDFVDEGSRVKLLGADHTVGFNHTIKDSELEYSRCNLEPVAEAISKEVKANVADALDIGTEVKRIADLRGLDAGMIIWDESSPMPVGAWDRFSPSNHGGI